MAKILFNANGFSNLAGAGTYSMFYSGSTYSQSTLWSMVHGADGSSPTGTKLMIFKGNPIAIDATSRQTSDTNDLLLDFTVGGYPSETFTSSGVRVHLGIQSTHKAASASGLATWFWFGRAVTAGSIGNTPFIIGTVGLPGSGSDLELDDVNIVDGRMYRSTGFYLNIPYEQTVTA
jgi:hypothetical protein